MWEQNKFPNKYFIEPLTAFLRTIKIYENKFTELLSVFMQNQLTIHKISESVVSEALMITEFYSLS